MLKFSQQEVGTIFVENTRVQNSHSHAINTHITPQKYIKTVIHDSKTNLAHCVARVFKIALVQVDLPVVNYWIFGTQFFIRDLFLSHFDSNFVRLRFCQLLGSLC